MKIITSTKKAKGFSSLEVLFLLLFLSTVSIAFVYYFKTQRIAINKRIDKYSEKSDIELFIPTILDKFKKCGNLGFNFMNDDIMNIQNDITNDFLIKIKSLSGLIDLNFLPLEFYKSEYFTSLLNSEIDNNPILNNQLILCYGDVEKLMTPDTFYNKCTVFSLININVAEQYHFEKYLEQFQMPLSFSEKRNSLLLNKQFLKNEIEAKIYYGLYYDELKPFISVLAPINVNFMDEDFLYSFLSLERFNIENVQAKVDTLISMQQTNGITREMLNNVLNISQNQDCNL